MASPKANTKTIYTSVDVLHPAGGIVFRCALPKAKSRLDPSWPLFWPLFDPSWLSSQRTLCLFPMTLFQKTLLGNQLWNHMIILSAIYAKLRGDAVGCCQAGKIGLDFTDHGHLYPKLNHIFTINLLYRCLWPWLDIQAVCIQKKHAQIIAKGVLHVFPDSPMKLFSR